MQIKEISSIHCQLFFMMIFCYLTPRVHSQLWFNCIFNDLFMYSPSAVIAQIGLRILDCIKAIEMSFGIRKELNTFFFLLFTRN